MKRPIDDISAADELTLGQPPCTCHLKPAEGMVRCRGCGRELFDGRCVLGISELLPADFRASAQHSGRALRVCATCMCDAGLTPLPPHTMAPGLVCTCRSPMAAYRILCPRLNVADSGLIVYESTVTRSTDELPAARVPTRIHGSVGLRTAISTAAASGHLLVVKAGEAWCPFSRLVDEAFLSFSSVLEQHEDELDAEMLRQRVRASAAHSLTARLATALTPTRSRDGTRKTVGRCALRRSRWASTTRPRMRSAQCSARRRGYQCLGWPPCGTAVAFLSTVRSARCGARGTACSSEPTS